MFPPNETQTESRYCSDSYKLLYYFLKEEKELKVYPMNENFGLTLIKMPGKTVVPDKSYTTITYQEFLAFMQDKKLYSPTEITEIINNE